MAPLKKRSLSTLFMEESKSHPPVEPAVQVPKPILYTGRLLQAIATSLAAKYAQRLFVTPLKHKMPKREFAMDQASTQEVVVIPEIKKEVVAYTYGNSEKRILLAHGWSGRGTQLVKIADELVKRGYQTISFDAPSHGKAIGTTTSLLEFIATIHEINRKFGPFEFAIGHSLGGMSLLNAISEGMNVKKLVTIGAADIISDIINDFIKALTLKPSVAKKMKANLDRKFGDDINQLSASYSAKQVTIPTLIVHDTDDADVNIQCAHSIHDALPDGELYITSGLGHRRILGNKKVIEKIVEFMLSDV